MSSLSSPSSDSAVPISVPSAETTSARYGIAVHAICGSSSNILLPVSSEPLGGFGTLSRVHDCHVHHAIHIARRPGPAAAEQVSVAKPINADQQTGVGCIKR